MKLESEDIWEYLERIEKEEMERSCSYFSQEWIQRYAESIDPVRDDAYWDRWCNWQQMLADGKIKEKNK